MSDITSIFINIVQKLNIEAHYSLNNLPKDMWLVHPNSGREKFLHPPIAIATYLIRSRDSSIGLGELV